MGWSAMCNYPLGNLPWLVQSHRLTFRYKWQLWWGKEVALWTNVSFAHFLHWGKILDRRTNFWGIFRYILPGFRSGNVTGQQIGIAAGDRKVRDSYKLLGERAERQRYNRHRSANIGQPPTELSFASESSTFGHTVSWQRKGTSGCPMHL